MKKLVIASLLLAAWALLSGFGVGVDGGQSGCWRPGTDGWLGQCARTGTGSCSAVPATYTGACIYYVSTSGNDSTCTGHPPPVTDTPPDACQHFSAAYALMRDQSSDQMRIKRGDTWTIPDYNDAATVDYFGETANHGEWCRRGLASNDPMVIGDYGLSSTQPLVQASNITSGNGNSVFWTLASGGGCDARNLAIIGINFSNYRTDPLNGAFSQAALDKKFAFAAINPSYRNGPGAIFLEDNKFYSLAMTLGGSQGGFQHYFLIRNTSYQGVDIAFVANNSGAQYSPLNGSLSGGYDMSGPSFYVEGNFLWHNGWREDVTCTGGCTRNVFSHNTYFQYSEGDGTQPMLMVMKNNISISGSDTGLRSRGGGQIDNNLSVQDATGIDYGNAFTTRGSSCPTLGAWLTAQCPQVPVAPGVNAITNNTVMASQSPNSTTTCGKGVAVAGILQTTSVSNNLIAHADPAMTSCTGIILAPPDAAGVTVSGNTICDYPTTAVSNTGTGSGLNTIGTNTLQASCTGTGPNPTRTVATYDTDVLGGPGTLTDFINQRLAMSKQNWNTNLTAPAVNNYLRAGYGLTAYPFLLKRDLDPAANDNTPLGLNAAA